MESIYGAYGVTYGGETVGRLDITRRGIRTELSCRCRRVSDRVLRLYCIGDGRVVPIGVLSPHREGLALCRVFTDNALAAMGLHKIDTAVVSETTPVIPAEKPTETPKTPEVPFWSPEPNPQRFFTDDTIVAACRQIRGAYSMESGGAVRLAVPVSSNEPFPAMPIFCFGEYARINDGDYIVFTVKDGKLV